MSPRIRCARRLGRAAQALLAEYLDQLNALGAELSVSSELAGVSASCDSMAQRGGDINAARADEPYRRAITGIYARLAATYQKLDRDARRRGRRRSAPSLTPMPRVYART